VLAEQELEVLIAADAIPAVDPTSATNKTAADSNGLVPSSTDHFVGMNGALVDQSMHRVLKTIKKLTVELFCGQHNPVRTSAFLILEFDIEWLSRRFRVISVKLEAKVFTKRFLRCLILGW
jgi:hypothetical protein